MTRMSSGSCPEHCPDVRACEFKWLVQVHDRDADTSVLRCGSYRRGYEETMKIHCEIGAAILQRASREGAFGLVNRMWLSV